MVLFSQNFMRAAVAGPSLALAACSFHASAGWNPDADATDASLTESPTPLRPSEGLILPATRSYLLWGAPEATAGRTVRDFQVCATRGTMDTIDGDDECPGETTALKTHAVLELETGATYFWKVRARFEDGTASPFGPVRFFHTDASVVGWWPLDEGTGTIAGDASPRNNRGALIGDPAWVTGFLGTALAFGPEKVVAVPHNESLDFPGDFSLSAWVLSNTTGTHQAIFHKGAYSLFKQATGRLTFFAPGCGIVASAGDVTPSTWHHVLARRAGATVFLYVDGVMTGSGACAADLSQAALFAMGCVLGTPCAEPFNGVLDELFAAGASTADPVNDFCAGQALAGVDPLPAACEP